MRTVLVLVLVVGACGSGSGDDAVDGPGGGADAAAAVDAADGEACPVTGYAACGGDVVGTWQIAAFCPDDPEAAAALFEHPYSDTPECADREVNTVDGVLVHTGTITFDASMATFATDEEARVTWGFTTACLNAVNAKVTAEQACAELGEGPADCTFAADFCTCTAVVPGKPSTSSVAYAIDGNALTIDGAATTYCVDGDRLTMDFAEHPVSWRYWVLDRT